MHTTVRLLLVLLLPVLAAAGEPAPAPLRLDLGGDVEMDLVWIPAGEFQMGVDDGSGDEAPVHAVTLTTGFWMGRHEVTQAQWERVMGRNPAYFPEPTRPVESVSWEDCRDFLKALNKTVAAQVPPGARARFPTEAEWVYACRAGTRTAFWFGDDAGQLSRYGNFADADETENLSWRDARQRDGFAGTAPVGSFPPNPWGLHDMHGNVWEWCSDWYGPYPSNAVVNPKGPSAGHRRVIRGGGWGVTAEDCRSANRYRFKPEMLGGNVGLRVVVSTEP